MSRYTLFLDISGAVTETTLGREYLTCAGVAIDSDSVSTAREALGALPKWRHSTQDTLNQIAGFLGGNATVCLVLRVEKRQPFWDNVWADAHRYHQELASKSRGRAGGFGKASQFIKYMLFGECSGRLLGEATRLLGKPRILNENGLGIVEVSAIHDSDIQGQENIEAYRRFWDIFANSPQSLLASQGIVVTVRDVVVTTEEEEPLLALPDHLAGLFQSEVIPDACPTGLSQGILRETREVLRRAGWIAVVDKSFDIDYRKVFGGGVVGSSLWPGVLTYTEDSGVSGRVIRTGGRAPGLSTRQTHSFQ